ncbi:Cytochrome c oxidase subunit 8A, mitochondrial [Bagarius yarrelli]|uniref:Cytochrome c oxidase subunit 8A, mitochondrial n=1 Tax=Bagarius yarrelli TaxID=175774 RepID=A0A556TX79_BAGYA|nr:Cytochrome c oxidase subunit 8A, mitochondrial [Bagarius yarrelli]
MSAFLRGLARIRSAPVLRETGITQRANVASKPARNSVGTAETTIGLVVFALTILAPSGWVLANLESYKKKEA